MWANQPIREWIDAVCQQYSRIMGCALTFDPQVELVSAIPPPAQDNAVEQWRIAIGDGAQTVGVLRLRNRTGQPRDAGYLQACEAAELTAKLIERVITARGFDDFRTDEGRYANAPSTIGDSGHSHRTGPLPDTSARDGRGTRVPTKLERLLDVARRMTGFPAAALFTHDDNVESPQLRALRTTESLRLLPAELAPFSSLVAPEGRADQITVIRRSIRCSGEVCDLPRDIATGVALPIADRGDERSVMWLFDRRDRRLTHRDRHALTMVAARLRQYVDQVRLIDESFQNREFKGELRAASRSQPSSRIEHLAPDGSYEIAGCMQCVREIGGDLLELIPLAPGRLFVAVGDAAGHSIPAALIMANVRGALRALFDGNEGEGNPPPARPPHEVLQRVNSILYGIVRSHQFMTMFCGVLDADSLTFEYANAGHPQPLLLRNGLVERLEAHGLVLGVTDDARYASRRMQLREGDVLVVYTDGVTEASCSARTQFGLGAMEEIARRNSDQSAAAIRDRLWAALQTHLAGSGQRDDRTLAVVRIAGR